MSDWEQSKQNFIDKLSNADRTFSEIFKIDAEGLVIQGDERAELERLQAANKKVLKKLQSREFTVAIVGLEKAGKSTLGNALIKSMVLPEYAERCTYTTTEIRSGDTDVAEVYFYSREEFNKNFKRMLNDVKYPDAVDFFGMTFEAFNRYWKAVETDPDQRGIFMIHNGTTAEDIKAILEGKNKIIQLLGQAPKKFGSEYWTGGDDFNEFKVYITGMSGKNPDGSVIRQPHPYAVKNVIIRSTQLAEMSHLVLYDVPGFDSPTELHKRQTEEMLKTTDAIILVTNVGDRPNLTGTQLDMLRKGQDADGIKLSAKAFVFGNKIDRASDAATAQNNLAALTNEAVSKYQIALANHIIGGSARAYLEGVGLISGNVAKRVIDEWQLPNGDGVGALHQKMQHYYDNDRFEVIRRRAESTLTKTKEVLDNLLERYSSGELNYTDVSAEILMDIQSRLPQFIKESNKVTKSHTSQIVHDAPFTSALKVEIENIYPLSNAEFCEELIHDIEYSLAIDPDGIYPATTINGNVRDKLGKIFVENIVTSAARLTIERQKNLRSELVESFLKIMGAEADVPNKAELEASVNELFDKMLIKEGSDCNFNALVERFVTTLIQTLISTPFAEDERLNKVKATLAELISLSVYYNMPTLQNNLQLENIGKDGANFFSKILVHESIVPTIAPREKKNPTANENFLRGVFEDFAEDMHINLETLPLNKWAQTITDAGINLVDVQADPKIKGKDKFGNRLENLFNLNWQNLSDDQRVQAIENLVNSYTKTGTAAAQTEGAEQFPAQLDELHEMAKKLKRMRSKDDMTAILDADIEILRDITAKAVINAIGLERAFISVVTKNVELIREHLQAGDGAKEFRAWIRNNAAKMMPSQFAQIIEQGAIRENRKAIVNSIKVMQSKMDI